VFKLAFLLFSVVPGGGVKKYGDVKGGVLRSNFKDFKKEVMADSFGIENDIQVLNIRF
jgi:hypothetical protein